MMTDRRQPAAHRGPGDRREEILQAAATLFAQKGYQRTAVREIAERAGIAPGTIYLYFEGKGDLLIQLMKRLTELEELDADLVGAFETDARTFLTTISRERMARLVENEEMVRAILPQMLVQPVLREAFYQELVEPLISLLEAYVQTRIEEGDIRPIDVPLTVRTVQSLFIGLLIVRILGDQQLQTRWEEMPELIGTLLFEGLNAGDAAEPGRQDEVGAAAVATLTGGERADRTEPAGADEQGSPREPRE
jgi:AcrR family transcriptional regulator